MNYYSQMMSRLKTPEAMKRFFTLYGRREGELARQLTRYTELVKRHEDIFHSDKPLCMVSASGRTEIVGNHTDHQNGRVMAAAVNLDTVAAVTPRGDMLAEVHSAGFPVVQLDLSDLSVREEEMGTSAALIRGVAAGMVERGYQVGGFDAAITSDVLAGSGLSSSAAFEVLICTILDKLYNGMTVDAVTRAKISQYAENRYFGKPSGLMDQMASSVGGLVYIDFKNLPADVEISPLNFDFAAAGYSLVVVNTRGSHDDLTDAYASIRTEMTAVAECMGEKVLRGANSEEFRVNIRAVAEKCGERACLRALHFFQENDRVKQMKTAVQSGDLQKMLSLITASGRSSWEKLQNVYMPGTHQPMALALASSEDLLDGKGAWRVHGGGFAGTTLNFVPDNTLNLFISRMEALFGSGCCFVLNVRPEGAGVVFD